MVQLTRSLCLSVDVAGYSGRDTPGQAEVQRDLVDLLDAAAVAVGLDRSAWLRQAAGDGELSVVAPDQSEVAVVEHFPLALARMVFARNVGAPGARRMRLRLAIDHGPVEPGANGFVGATAVAVSRLVDSAAARAVLARGDAALVQILSDRVFLDVVKAGHAGDPDEYRPVAVRVKEFDARAWLRAPGVDLPADEPEAPPRAPEQAVNASIGAFTMNGGTFGISNTW